ncbi:integrase family protein [Desulfovibrio ferrophilus]|uniref:Integrase family protein n=1 Tax=Desulfovibrio ferrophilus TaxID=241368 RepID=A0A2Z6B375_9BACT|nr:integrase family protein [Desulfovibrio ferrophilus]
MLERRAYLDKMRSSRGIEVVGNYVVSHLDGPRMGDIKTAWKRVCKDLDLTDFHFHDNRHTFCSNIIMAGGTLKHAKEMIGHKTLRMTDRYSHLEAARDNPIHSILAAHYGSAS